MIHTFSVDIADKLIRSGLPADKKEVYVYGLECSLNLIISDSILLTYAFYMGQIPELLLWLICFSLLRTHVGGYHAPSHFLCISSHYLCYIYMEMCTYNKSISGYVKEQAKKGTSSFCFYIY